MAQGAILPLLKTCAENRTALFRPPNGRPTGASCERGRERTGREHWTTQRKFIP
jgi:hypothetical protein